MLPRFQNQLAVLQNPSEPNHLRFEWFFAQIANLATLIFCLVIKKNSISVRAGAPDSGRTRFRALPRAETRTWTRTWTRNLDKFYHVLAEPLVQVCPGNLDKELGQLRAAGSLSLEGVSQMVYILPERLLALVRPAFDLVLRRI